MLVNPVLPRVWCNVCEYMRDWHTRWLWVDDAILNNNHMLINFLLPYLKKRDFCINNYFLL